MDPYVAALLRPGERYRGGELPKMDPYASHLRKMDPHEVELLRLAGQPVTGAAVESGSQAVNEINSQAPIVNVVSDSSSKVNAPVTSTVVNYTPGSSNARNSDNSVRQFSINALSRL
jgi:hypothetical protein